MSSLMTKRHSGLPLQPAQGPVWTPGLNLCCSACQVALSNNGTVYVGDGYCNSRVVEYAPDGTWRGSFELPAPQKMQIPHALAIDECQSTLYVADREAGLVHSFSTATRQLQGKGQIHKAKMGPPDTWEGSHCCRMLANLIHLLAVDHGCNACAAVGVPWSHSRVPSLLHRL